MTTARAAMIAIGAVLGMACVRALPPTPAPPVVRSSEPVFPPTPDLDSLAVHFATAVDTAAPHRITGVEDEIRVWLGRLEYEDETLRPAENGDPRFFRRYRGRLLDSLGWAAFRRGDTRQAEAALLSAAREINNRGTTDGYAEHFLHIGQLYRGQGRWDEAVDAFLDAETRGAGARATPMLEDAYRRRRGSLRGLDALRTTERARIEDERTQLLVADPLSERLPDVTYARRTGPPLALHRAADGPFVVAIWDQRCPKCGGYANAIAPLADRLRQRRTALIGVWLGGGKADAAGPPQPYTIVAPVDPLRARTELRAALTPQVLVVDGTGSIRYRWAGDTAMPPPIDDILVQVDHLRSRAETLRTSRTRSPARETR